MTDLLQEQQEDHKNTVVSYTILDASDILKVATVINVQLTLDDASDDHRQKSLPFVFPNGFENVKDYDKVFILGPSGCGKSRSIIELLSNSDMALSGRIYVINPRNDLGKESGRITISTLIDKLNGNDVVIWDNFPDDMIKRDIANAQKVLEIISSKPVRKILISLKPRYLGIYKDLPLRIPEFYTYDITYDKNKIKRMIELYGISSISQFKGLYDRYISKDLDKASRILWQKEPTPLTVLDYYKELVFKRAARVGEAESRKSLNIVLEAEKLPRSTNYYRDQFELLTNVQDRESEAHFLYVLKLCYEIGLERTQDKIGQLQEGIFGSTISNASTKNLNTWIYNSGQYFAMHDVCRDSIKMTDYIKAKITKYMCDNFSKILIFSSPEHQQQMQQQPSEQFLYSLALFLGKNMQFIPRDITHTFLPDTIYGFMKKKAQFENALGYGVGETFEDLDEELQQLIMDRIDTEIEFASGMAESLGHLFPMCDDKRRQELMLKIYSGGLFARHFGQSLGRILKYIPQDIKQELFAHIERNSQLADGLGMGLGHVYPSLDKEFQKEIFLLAQRNSEMSRGLGLGFGLRYLTMNPTECKETFAKADTDTEFDKGFGMGLAVLFNKHRNLLPTKFFENEILNWGSKHTEFMFGFGINSVFTSLEQVPEEIITLMDKDGELAYGGSMGFGMYFLYMPEALQQHILSKAAQNIKLDLGLGSGLGIVFKHLPKEVQNGALVFGRGNTKSEYDAGIGFGIGFMWPYQKPEVVKEVYARIATNNRFAFGLGYGLGFIFEYFSKEIKEKIFSIANHNPEFDTGLGLGIGYIFRYLNDELSSQVLARATASNGFAFGLGRGLGRIFRYLPEQVKNDILFQVDISTTVVGRTSPTVAPTVTRIAAIAKNNTEFIRGFGSGLGSYAVMMYVKDETFLKKVFQRVNENGEFSAGLGEGLGYSFRYLPDKFQQEVLEDTILKNSEFAKGLGIGFGSSFEYLTSHLKTKLFAISEKNVQFSVGLGIGLGRVYAYLSTDVRKDIFTKAVAGSGLARGFGIGLGSIFTYLTDDLRSNMLHKHLENAQFARGFGEGIGKMFNYLHPTLAKKMLESVTDKNELAAGLGTGLGSIFTYTDDGFKNKVYLEAENNPQFARGFGAGLGSAFPYIPNEVVNNIFYSRLEKNVQFQRALGFAIGHVYIFLSEQKNNAVLKITNKNPQFAYGLGDGLGHIFSSFKTETQEKLLKKAEQSNEFGRGLGEGIAKAFKELNDRILEREILLLAARTNRDSEFALGLGSGLGKDFPSLTDEIHQEILKIVDNECLFTKGFSTGLRYSFRYLSKDLQRQISILGQNNSHFSYLVNGDQRQYGS